MPEIVVEVCVLLRRGVSEFRCFAAHVEESERPPGLSSESAIMGALSATCRRGCSRSTGVVANQLRTL